MNTEKQKAYDKAYRKANSDKVKAYNKAYHEANKEKRLVYTKGWREVNSNKTREYGRKRRVLKYKTQIEHINEKEVYLRDGWICQICKTKIDKRFKYPNPMSASLDHIIPLSQGGTHTYNNIQLAHLLCNMTKYTNTLPQGEQMRLF